MSGNDSAEPDVIWEGSPWVTPGLVGLTLEAILFSVVFAYIELAALRLGADAVGWTIFIVAVVWLLGAARLELIGSTNRYLLRQSSLEIESGIVEKRVFTVSAAGFSNLEVIRNLSGRILNMGDIVVETDSDRDIRLLRIRSPVRVSSMIRDVMTVPTVRVAGNGPSLVADRRAR